MTTTEPRESSAKTWHPWSVELMIGPGIVVGGGFGLQYMNASEEFTDLPLSASVIAGSGVRPRLLFSVGFAFGADGKPAEMTARM